MEPAVRALDCRSRGTFPRSMGPRVAQLAAARPRPGCAGRSSSSTSGRTPASTGYARFPTCARGRRSTGAGAGRGRRPHARVLVRERRRERSTRPRARWRWRTRSRSTATTPSGTRSRNRYWPALYFVDAQGRIRHHRFGEGDYDECERVIQQLLREAGATASGTTWSRSTRAASRRRPTGRTWGPRDLPRLRADGTSRRRVGSRSTSHAPTSRRSGCGSISGRFPGEWTVERRAERAERGRWADRVPLPRPRRASRHGTAGRGAPVRFRVLIDGEPPGAAHGIDVDERATGRSSSRGCTS